MAKAVTRAPQAFSAEFCWLRAGDLLVHPRTRDPIATVERVKHSSVERPGKPTRYTVTLVLDEIQ